MAESKSPKQAGRGWTGTLMNVGLAVLGLVVLLLLYALGTRVFAPRVDAAREANPGQLVGRIIQVEVRNGCGADGVAGDLTRFLRRSGFDVVEVGNHTSFDEPHSLVIDRIGDLEAARKVAHALGIAEEYVRQDVRPGLYLDATVVIGKDYAILKPFD